MSKTKAFKRFLTALLAAALIMSACAPAALASFKARVFTNTRVYISPSTKAYSVAVPNGLKVTVTAYRKGWAQVTYKGHVGYMPCAYLNLADRLTAYTAKSTPVYWQPSSSSGTMGTLSIATPVYVVNKVNGYYRIQNSSGSVTGYVKGSYLTTKAKITAAYNAYKQAAAQAAAKAAAKKSSSGGPVALMQSLCGKPYSKDANPPKSFNCSTFVAYVWYLVAGKKLPGSAAAQASVGSKVSSPKLGDILCFDFNGDGKCDHTAIYVGDGGFYEASEGAGCVRGMSFYDSKRGATYKAAYMGARRP